MRKFEITYRTKRNNEFINKVVIESENDLGILLKGHMKLRSEHGVVFNKRSHNATWREVTNGVSEHVSMIGANLGSEISELDNFADINRCMSVLLKKVQEHVIGYRRSVCGDWECVVDNGEYYVRTYQVLSSFGLVHDQLAKVEDDESIVLFPDGKTLSDMLTDPIGFSEWTNKNLD